MSGKTSTGIALRTTDAERNEGLNWAAINVGVEYDKNSKKIVLPGDPEEMDFDSAIESLERIKEQESQQFDVKEIVKGAPWDALYALFQACQDIYGVVTSHSIKTWFGDIKPEFATINTGPKSADKIQVPLGLMRVPGVTQPFYLNFHGSVGAILHGTVNRKDQTRLVEIANRARHIIKTRSIYKGKAIRLNVHENGELNMEAQPEFLELDAVRTSDMVHTQETNTLINTNIFTPLIHSDGCRKHKIPLKRGILLEGPYGTGKSLTARVTAKVAIDHDWTFIMLNRSQGLKAAIEFGRAYQPCVIFAEDIDRAADRSNEAVNDLVNLIDGVVTKDMEMMVVLTTNFIERIDQALLRPGRFDAIITLQLPDAETAGRLITTYARELLPPDTVLTRVGELLQGQTPAIIREVVEKSKLSMLAEDRTELNESDLYAAALSMTRQMELLRPKDRTPSDAEVFFNSFKGIVAKGVGQVTGVDNSEEFEGIKTMLNSVHSNLSNKVDKDIALSSGAHAKAQETLEAVGTLKKALTAGKK